MQIKLISLSWNQRGVGCLHELCFIHVIFTFRLLCWALATADNSSDRKDLTYIKPKLPLKLYFLEHSHSWSFLVFWWQNAWWFLEGISDSGVWTKWFYLCTQFEPRQGFTSILFPLSSLCTVSPAWLVTWINTSSSSLEEKVVGGASGAKQDFFCSFCCNEEAGRCREAVEIEVWVSGSFSSSLMGCYVAGKWAYAACPGSSSDSATGIIMFITLLNSWVNKSNTNLALFIYFARVNKDSFSLLFYDSLGTLYHPVLSEAMKWWACGARGAEGSKLPCPAVDQGRNPAGGWLLPVSGGTWLKARDPRRRGEIIIILYDMWIFLLWLRLSNVIIVMYWERQKKRRLFYIRP